MNLDRKLIKSQAKELIRGKVMKLFITILIITLCNSCVSIVINAITMPDDIDRVFENPGNYFEQFDNDFNIYGFGDYDDYNDYDDNYDDYDDDYNPYEDDFENFGTENNSGRSDFYKYGTSFVPTDAKTVIDNESAKTLSINPSLAEGLSYISLIAEILLLPLTVVLAYYFVLFIRGREFSGAEGLKFIFKEAFTKDYGKKIWIGVLRALIMMGLGAVSFFILFIPMWIFYYSSFFAFEIMCDNPQLSAWEAIKISKKMIKGNRSELFWLDVSFIPWTLLCVFIFPAIYALPYIYTTKALYYENFRIRAMQMGRITEDDFLTEAQKMQKYANQNSGAYQPNANQQQGYAQANPYQYNNTGYYNPQQNNTYTAPQANNAPEQNNAYSAQQSNPYSAPQNTYTAPQQNVYSPAQDNTYAEQPSEPVIVPPAPTAEETAEPTAEAEKPIQPEAETAAPAEDIKPSEKYTPVTPPSEEYNKTEDTTEN